MKSLKKKVCVSVFLDELFEAVDEDGRDYICNKLDKIREGDTRIVRSQIISEEILFQRVTRPRKYRNALRISQRGRVFFQDQLRGMETEEDWRPPVVEKVDRETATSLKSDDENDFDVDEYSLSDLNLESLELYEEQGEELKSTRKVKRVDIALSTCFTEGLSNAGESLPEMNPQSGAGLLEQAKKLHGSTQTDEDAESEKVCLKGQKIVEDISQNNKCFLVSKCAKSTNLAAWNHKSTQFSLPTSLSPHQVNTVRELDENGSELEEVFHYMNSRKNSVNVLKRANHVLTNKFIRMPPQVPETKHDVIGDFFQMEEKWGCTVEETESKIIKKGFCDVTVKTFVKTNREHIICYTLSVPWELTNFGELIIPENSLTSRHSINDPLTLFMTRPRDISELGCFLMGTQCRNAIGKWGDSSNDEISSDVSTSGRQGSDPVTAELPREEQGRKDKQTEEEVKERSEQEIAVPNNDETSTLEERKVVESLASEITEQMKLLEMKKEERVVADKSINTEPQTKAEEDDLSVQWELEIEIQNEESSEVKDTAKTDNSNTQMIKAIEGSSQTNVVLICQSPYENSLVIEDCSQHSRLSEVEQCYLKDEKIRKMYLANVPRRILHVTEQRLKEIGRS